MIGAEDKVFLVQNMAFVSGNDDAEERCSIRIHYGNAHRRLQPALSKLQSGQAVDLSSEFDGIPYSKDDHSIVFGLYATIVRYYVRLGSYDELDSLFNLLKRKRPANMESFYSMALGYAIVEKSDIGMAERILGRASRSFSKDRRKLARPALHLANAYLDRGQVKQAKVVLELIDSSDFPFFSSWTTSDYAIALWRTGDIAKAKEVASKIPPINDNSSGNNAANVLPVYYVLGYTKQINEAKQFVNFEASPGVVGNIVEALVRAGNLDDAELFSREFASGYHYWLSFLEREKIRNMVDAEVIHYLQSAAPGVERVVAVIGLLMCQRDQRGNRDSLREDGALRVDQVLETPVSGKIVSAGPEAGRDYAFDLGGGEKLELVWIAALKGWVGKYEVTNGQYRRFKSGHSSGDFKGKSLNGDDQPVVRVSFNDAEAFAKWLNGKFASELPSGYRFGLPDGKEWITFAQCGDGRTYPWGNSMPPKYGNYNDLTAREQIDFTGIDGYRDGHAVSAPVASSGRNDWGLYGVGGNVWEWTTETSGSSRVLRGASWVNDRSGDFLRCEGRGRDVPSSRYFYLGFRVCLFR